MDFENFRDLLVELGVLFDTHENAYLIYYMENGYEARLVALIDGDILRIAYPTDIEPQQEVYEWIAKRNFEKTLVKYCVDTEGFLTIMIDVPLSSIDKDFLKRIFRLLVISYRELASRIRSSTS